MRNKDRQGRTKTRKGRKVGKRGSTRRGTTNTRVGHFTSEPVVRVLTSLDVA